MKHLHLNLACGFESGLVLIRNPFDAILAAFNHHKAGKVGEPPMSAFIGNDWPKFIENYAMRWRIFHLEWLNRYGASLSLTFFDAFFKAMFTKRLYGERLMGYQNWVHSNCPDFFVYIFFSVHHCVR